MKDKDYCIQMISFIDQAEIHYSTNWTSSLSHRPILFHVNYTILLPFIIFINRDCSKRMNILQFEIILLHYS